jgi:hypothetical protein
MLDSSYLVYGDRPPLSNFRGPLQTGKAALLVDGIDEISDGKRTLVKSWIEDLVSTYPDTKFILTSRPTAVAEGWLDPAGFTDAELQPMDLNDINAFIDHWHAAILEEERAPSDKPLPEQAAQLKHLIRGSRALRNLATNPLLCALICAMNRTRKRQLPNDRIELYEACCQMLLERRDKERSLSMVDYPDLTYRQKRVLLEDLAYWMICNTWSEISVIDAQARIALKLQSVQNLPVNATSANVLKLLVERCGLIRCPTVGKMDFAHRTFEEFLAAKAALEELDVGVLITNAHDDQWREVITLAAGQATMRLRDQLINGLIDRGVVEPDKRHRLHLLAVACLETSVELQPATKSKVEDCLQRLIPPHNMSEAKALSAAGELAVPYLKKKTRRDHAVTCAAQIRTLGLIGTESALEAIEQYSTDNRITVTNELLRAWTQFDQSEYAARVLSNRRAISVSRAKSLDGFQHLKDLETLQIIDGSNLVHLDDIAGLKNLHQLDIFFAPTLLDISGLRGMPRLESLGITGTSLLDSKGFSPVAECKEILSLRLFNCSELTDVNFLLNSHKLTSVDFGACQNLTNLYGLIRATQLKKIQLYNLPIKSLDFILELESLESLMVIGCNELTDIAAIKDLSRLTSCQIHGCPQVKDVFRSDRIFNHS